MQKRISPRTLRRRHNQHCLVDFSEIARVGLINIEPLLLRWLPDGKREGQEWVARNPNRADRTPGSFKVNIRTGRWADFATGNAGGDVISLAAYLQGIGQLEAARNLQQCLGA